MMRKVRAQEQRYEGLPASSMIAMAVMERSGIRALIDSLAEYDDERKLTPGMAVKVMLGPMADHRKKTSLSRTKYFYNAAPVDLLFGPGVDRDSLNDNALARNLDAIWDAGPDRLFWRCSSLIKERYGFDSKIRHMDATNYSVYAVPPDDAEECVAVPAFGGNAKNGRNDLLQYSAATVTDGDRILEYCKAHSGNASDVVMNKDTMAFLEACIKPSENTVVADCKLVNDGLISELNGMGMGFVSKLPSSFSEKIRDRIVDAASASEMTASGIKGYSIYECEEETSGCGKLRFIACRSPAGTKKAMDYLERQGKRDAEKRFKVFAKKEFACETDAIAMFDDVMRTHRGSAYAVTREILRIEEAERRKTRGRPRKGSGEPGAKVVWKVRTSMEFDKKRAEELAYVHGISVIVTNLPRVPKDAENIRFGATSDTVLRLYLDQYKPEHTYRLMKSGMGVSSVYVHTPSRAAALLFTVAVATLVNSVMDALLRRNAKGKSRTVSRICTEIQGAILAYDRDGDEIYVMGPDGSASKVFSFMDSLGLDPSTLLDTFGG